MNFIRIFNQVQLEFDTELAIVVNGIITIQLSRMPTMEEINNTGLYEQNITKQCKEIFWETPKHIFDQAVNIWLIVYDWEIRQDMHGLGGCTIKSLKELLHEKSFCDIRQI